MLADCKVMGLFGQRVDPKYGGLGMTSMESVIVAEAMGYNPALFATITVHEALGVKVRFVLHCTPLTEMQVTASTSPFPFRASNSWVQRSRKRNIYHL